jgi:fumarate hydratase class II
MHVAVAMEINRCLLPGLKELQGSLAEKGDQFKDIIKIGRTHTQVIIRLSHIMQINLAHYPVQSIINFCQHL